MAEELEGLWRSIHLQSKKKIALNRLNQRYLAAPEEEEKWMVGKLLTRRPSNKKAMMGILKLVWRLAKTVETTALEENLFLFKFQSYRTKIVC